MINEAIALIKTTFNLLFGNILSATFSTITIIGTIIGLTKRRRRV